MTDTVWVVLEDGTIDELNSSIRRVFSNREAATEYVEDDENAGNFSIHEEEVIDDW